MSAASVPARAWVVTGAGTAINLCLGILYAWSMWNAAFVAKAPDQPGDPMKGINQGWTYLDEAQATWAYSICGVTFSLCMIPGGRLQDRYGAKLGATLGGLFLATGCIIAGLSKSYVGVVLGFGVLGGIGMGLGYAAATPAAVKWFHAKRRGLVVGLVVAGYGAAAVYISPLAQFLITNYGITGSFVGLGLLFAVVVVVAGRLLNPPPPGYVAPAPQASGGRQPPVDSAQLDSAQPSQQGADAPRSPSGDTPPSQMLKTWQFYALVFLFVGAAQSGLLVIAKAKTFLNDTAVDGSFFRTNAWLLVTFVGVVNALGRVGTGRYSDRIGRLNAYAINGLVSVVCLLAAPWVLAERNVALLFLVIGVMAWQYGGALAVMPAVTADYYGSKNLGMNYGLVFIGWGVAFFVPLLGGYLQRSTGRWDEAFYISAGLLLAAVLLSRAIRRPA